MSRDARHWTRDAGRFVLVRRDVSLPIPADAVTSSASGLDPHIAPANAYAQAARVARAGGATVEQVRSLVARSKETRFFGEPRVNVLGLNLAVVEMRRR